MPLDILTILQEKGEAVLTPWAPGIYSGLEGARASDLSANDWLLEADSQMLRIRWFIESVVPQDVAESNLATTTAKVLEASLRTVQRHFPHLGQADQRQLTRSFCAIAQGLIAQERAKRESTSRATKRQLIAISAKPSCYLCNAAFGDAQIAAFLGEAEHVDVPEPFVDFIYPRGARASDKRISVEHIRPLNDGGSNSLENLALACNYCNGMKNDALTIFDRGRYPQMIEHPDLGAVFRPNPFWVLRLLALRKRCHVCGTSSQEARLLPSAEPGIRFFNPANLQVVCEDHDDMRAFRLVPRRVVVRES